MKKVDNEVKSCLKEHSCFDNLSPHFQSYHLTRVFFVSRGSIENNSAIVAVVPRFIAGIKPASNDCSASGQAVLQHIHTSLKI